MLCHRKAMEKDDHVCSSGGEAVGLGPLHSICFATFPGEFGKVRVYAPVSEAYDGARQSSAQPDSDLKLRRGTFPSSSCDHILNEFVHCHDRDVIDVSGAERAE